MSSVNNVKKVILIGAGSRGCCYTDKISDAFSNDFKVVAVAEPREHFRNYIKEKHGIDESMCFESWEPLLGREKIADIAIIATMDRDHIGPALAAIDKGYNLLLEKPIAPTPEECRTIQCAAEKKGVFVLICHVLRYSKLFITLKEIIDSGEIGKVMNIQHIEAVGNEHQSHSFVRGNWRNSEESSPMILQKCCHDMDILAWLIGKKCKKVQSFGSRTYFVRENAPADAPEYCIEGCPHESECPYSAIKVYLKNENNDWFRPVAAETLEPSDKQVEEAIRHKDYGKCVFKCPNNVVDHQVVNLEFEDNVYVNFTMSAFTKGGREIKIMGTGGEINASLDNPIISIYRFKDKSTKEVNLDDNALGNTLVSGHGGGDFGIMMALKDLSEGRDNKSACDIRESCDNHMIAFAAEESRLLGGKLIDLEEFSKKFD